MASGGLLLVWTRLLMPDGSSIVLERLPGVDGAGYSGVEDGVNWHWGRIFAGAALTTLLGVNAQLVAANTNTNSGSIVIATRQSAQDSVNQVGQQITRKNLSIQPTLTARPRTAPQCDRQQGHRPSATFVNRPGEVEVSLKIGPLPNPEKVKLLVQVSAELKELLDEYARIHSQAGGRPRDAVALIPHMLQQFIDRDRGFRMMRKSRQNPPSI